MDVIGTRIPESEDIANKTNCSHEFPSVSSVFCPRPHTMAWRDSQWRTSKTSSWWEQSGPYSYRDSGDKRRIPWPKDQPQKEPVRLVARIANPGYGDKEDDKGFEYLNELNEHDLRVPGWTWHICCRDMKSRAIRARDSENAVPKGRADDHQKATYKERRDNLFDIIRRHDGSVKTKHQRDDQARVAAMAIEAMEVGTPLLPLRLDNQRLSVVYPHERWSRQVHKASSSR